MPSKVYSQMVTLLEVCSKSEKKKILNLLRKEFQENEPTTAKKVDVKRPTSFKSAKKKVESIDDGTKVFIEDVAGYFSCSIQTVYNNSEVFRVSGVVQETKISDGQMTKSRAFGRKTVYSPKLLRRLKKFMLREGLTSFASVRRKMKSDPLFSERLSKIRWSKSL